MVTKNICKLTNNELLLVSGGWQENIYKMVGHYRGGKTYTVIGIVSTKDGWKCHWKCSCGYSRTECSDKDLEIIASQHLRNAHSGYCWGECKLDITRG